ncbi:class I SAM-dependent methyltransferase [Alkalicoccus chagannorensis]|uniref:class I SAM-dependent methyltransferase n=1 Tax=Alkalicoccus chagannorensis TaxID=427072 RepID=UPI0003FAAEB2|nr:class I SAM-dependent methyltransferase [Alkalicoccus chagannorensis]
MNTAVTTAAKHARHLRSEAESFAQAYHVPYIQREKQSLETLLASAPDGLFILERDTISWTNGHSYRWYHPNTAVLRLKRLARGQNDALVDAAAISPGDSMIDATAGLGADALVCAGAGASVTAVESEAVQAVLLREGLRRYPFAQEWMKQAAARITVVHSPHTGYLQSIPDGSTDIVYFDPAFYESVDASSGIDMLRDSWNTSPLQAEAVAAARTKAARIIVVKDHFRSPVFEEFGFDRLHRPSAKQHYGIINTGVGRT